MTLSFRPIAMALAAASFTLPCLALAQTTVHEIVVRPSTGASEVRTERVSFTDLNLDHPSGARALLMRIRGAAQRVCGPDEGLHSGGGYKACIRDAVNRAVNEVGNPLVSSLNQKRG